MPTLRPRDTRRFAFRCLLRLAPAAIALPSVQALPLRVALAQSDSDRATARALGQEGEAALEAKDYPTAEDRFRRADKLIHAPTLELGLARALVGVGKLVEAQETYNRIVREGVAPGAPAAFMKAMEAAKNEVGAVSPRLGMVTITVKGAGGAEVPNASVTLDGAAVNTASLGVKRFIDPGSHVLQASGTGFKQGELRFNVSEGQTTAAPLTLEVAPPGTVAATTPGSGAPEGAAGATGGTVQSGPEPGPTHKGPGILPWIAFGVGGAGLILGGITGGLALGAHSTLAGECPATTCPADKQGDLNSYHLDATLSTVGFIVAGAGAVAGVVLLLTAPKGENPPAQAGFRVVPVLGPGSVGAVGQF